MGLLAYPLGQAAFAHHGLANFNLNVGITVSGTIRDIALINPHSWVYLNVVNDDATTTEWKCGLRGGTVLRSQNPPVEAAPA